MLKSYSANFRHIKSSKPTEQCNVKLHVHTYNIELHLLGIIKVTENSEGYTGPATQKAINAGCTRYITFSTQ